MKTNHLFTSLLVLILIFILSGCAGISTQKKQNLSCTTVDINAMLNSGDFQKKADNFIIIQDATSSMLKRVDDESLSSYTLLTTSKALIRCMNNSLPDDFGVNAGMRIFGSHSSDNGLVYGMSLFSNAGLEEGVLAIKSVYNKTDLVTAIGDTSNDLKQVTGKTAVIILSDGGKSNNLDTEIPGDSAPVAAAASMKEMYGENVCIYTILLGDNPDGRITMEQIAAQGGCGFATEANNLYLRPLRECDTVNTGKGMGDFVARVFLEKFVPPPPPKPDLDSDGDGVLDSRDKCPDTPQGIEVDKDGCPIPFEEDVSITLLVEFDFDKAEVKFLFHEEIDKVANLLTAYPKTTVELEGHTDSIGSDEYNMALSRRRAESVKKYLVEKFNIDETRISTIGFGESSPVATNDTEEGRQSNRRVIANIEAVIEK